MPIAETLHAPAVGLSENRIVLFYQTTGGAHNRRLWSVTRFKNQESGEIQWKYMGGARGRHTESSPVSDDDFEDYVRSNREPTIKMYGGYERIGSLLIKQFKIYLYFRNYPDNRAKYLYGIFSESERSPGVYSGYFKPVVEVPGSRTSAPPDGAHQPWILNSSETKTLHTVAFRYAGRIKIKALNEDNSWIEIPFPDNIRTGDTPTLTSFRGFLHIVFRGERHNGENDYRLFVARATSNDIRDPDWRIQRIPAAYSRRAPSVAVYNIPPSGNVDKREMLVVFAGHNNNFIWIRRSADAINWENYGYIDGLKIAKRPSVHRNLFREGHYDNERKIVLAYKPYGKSCIRVGEVKIDTAVGRDLPGHRWLSINEGTNSRYSLNCE